MFDFSDDDVRTIDPTKLTKLTALQVSIKMWEHIEAKGVSKTDALKALGFHHSDYLYQSPCCEYVVQQANKPFAMLPCKEYCPAWYEFSASDHSPLTAVCPGVLYPASHYTEYPETLSESLEVAVNKIVGRDMVKLLKEAYERNINESKLNSTEPLAADG